jgi:alpha/beta superfamily hydrolase
VAEVSLRGPAGLLVARHDPPAAPLPPGSSGMGGPLAAVICHPHPLYGGTLDNKVVHGLMRAVTGAGLHALRFNFRGSGGSEGQHEAGAGEVDDVRAALDRVAELAGPEAGRPGRLLVAGYSFGSFVGLTAALDAARVGARLAVAPPVNFSDFARIAADGRPLAVIYSAADELVPADLVERWIATCRPPPAVTVLRGTGHMFHGQVHAVRDAAAEFVATLSRPALGC